MTCKERNYELITEITAYPDSAVTMNFPFQKKVKYLTSDDYSLDDKQSVLIPMKAKSGKLSETENTGVQGDSYTTTLSWEVEIVTKEVMDKLAFLENSFKHLKIKTFGDNVSLVVASEDGYRFTLQEDAGILKCEVSIKNVNGAQRIL